MLNEALRLHKQGFKIIPVSKNKTPNCKEWKKYQIKQTEEDITNLFKGDNYGIALLTGVDGIEVIDIDSKYALDKYKFETDFFDATIDTLGADTFTAMVLNQTQNKGYHMIYKCEKIRKKKASIKANNRE